MKNIETLMAELGGSGCLLDVLKAVQAERGYLSDDDLRSVAAAFGREANSVYETASFYGMLSLAPEKKNVLEFCGSVNCEAAGRRDVAEAAEREIAGSPLWEIKRCECQGRCDTAPNVVLNGTAYPSMTPEKIRALIRKAGV